MAPVMNATNAAGAGCYASGIDMGSGGDVTSIVIGITTPWRDDNGVALTPMPTPIVDTTGNNYVSGQLTWTPPKITVTVPYPVSTPFVATSAVSGYWINTNTTITNTSAVYNTWTVIYVNGVPLHPGNVVNFGSNAMAWYPPEMLKKINFKEKLAANLRPNIDAKNGALMSLNADPAERRARRLLSDLISREEFRRYLVRGFIMVKGRSGILYKVSGGHKQIISYVKNKETGKYEPFESFCVVFRDGSLPFTDGVIMRKLLIDTDEFRLNQIANVHKVSPQRQVRVA